MNEKVMNSSQNLWHKLTAPRAVNADESRREYTTRVSLVILNVIVLLITPLVIIGWLLKIFDLPVLIIAVGVVPVFVGGFWLAHRGYWSLVSYMPPLIVYLVAVINNFLDGPGSGAMLYYALAIVLATMLQGVKAQWSMLILSLSAYVGFGWAHAQGYLPPGTSPETALTEWVMDVTITLVAITFLLWFLIGQFQRALIQAHTYATELEKYKDSLENQVAQRTIELQESYEMRERLHQQILDTQQQIIRELSTPVIPIMDHIIVLPLVGSIDSLRARDVTRNLLAGISQHRAKVVILDVTGVSIMDTGIVNHLNKTIQVARLKGAETIVTGMSDAVAEAIVDLGIDWSGITTLADLQTGLLVALDNLGVKLTK